MLLLESVAIALAQRHDRAHIHLVEGGQHGGGVLRLLEPLGDALAQAASCAPAPRARRPTARSAVSARCSGRGAPCGDHVRLGDRPSLPVAGILRRVAACSPRPACARRDPSVRAPLRLSLDPLPRAGRGRQRPSPGAGAGAAGAQRRASGCCKSVGDRAENGADLDVGALLGGIRPACPRRAHDLERHLVGFELTTGSSTATASPGFSAIRDRGLGHRFTEARDLDLGRPRLVLCRQRLVDQVRLFFVVALGGRSPASRLGPADIARPLAVISRPASDLLDAAVDEGPGAHIFRLLLAPDDLGVAIALQHLAKRVERERVELLDPHERDP